MNAVSTIANEGRNKLFIEGLSKSKPQYAHDLTLTGYKQQGSDSQRPSRKRVSRSTKMAQSTCSACSREGNFANMRLKMCPVKIGIAPGTSIIAGLNQYASSRKIADANIEITQHWEKGCSGSQDCH